MSKSIYKNTIYRLLLNAFNFLVPLITGPYIARLLDEELYGLYNKATAELVIFTIMAAFGIYNYAVREVAKVRNDKNKCETLFTSLFILNAVSTSISIILYLCYVKISTVGISSTIYLILGLQIMANFLMVEWVNESSENYGFITAKTIIVRGTTTAALFMFVTKPSDIIKYVLIVSITQVLNNLLSFIYVKRKYKFQFKNLVIKKHIKQIFIIFIITNANILYTQLDKLALGNFSAEAAVTRYVIPQTITTIIFTLLVSISMVTIPRLSYYLNQGEKEKYSLLLEESASVVLLISIPVFLGIFCIAEPVISLYSGIKYIDAYPVLAIFSLRSLLMVYYCIFVNQIMYIFKKEKIILKYLAIYGVMNVISKIVLVRFDVLTPVTAISTTILIELFLVSSIYKYIKNNIDINFKLFTKQHLIYIGSSLLFIPVTIAVNVLNINIYIRMIIIILICSILYFGILIIMKNPSLNKFKDMIIGKLKKR